MPPDDEVQTELLRQFKASLAGMGFSDLNQVVGDLSLLGQNLARAEARPELRRAPLAEPAIFRIRVDLDDAKPPIWRRLDLRSDLTLDVVHQVLQIAFDWDDYHLHRFSLGGHPFDRTSQLFLCLNDVEEGESSDDGGIPAVEVRLDETLQEPGDVLQYAYDYGDGWELRLRLEGVLPASLDSPTAVAVDGRRAAPPEDSGGRTDAAGIGLHVEDPARFDLDELNEALRSSYVLIHHHGVDPRLIDLVNRLRSSSVGEELAERIGSLITGPTEPEPGDLGAFHWFLDRAKGGGIELTAAGYLKPADVEAAAAALPSMDDWYGKANREINARPLLHFRESLVSIGLLRKYKGSLVLTRAGAAAQRDPARLWTHLAERIMPAKADEFEVAATLLLLAHAGSSPGASISTEQVAAALTELGWLHHDGSRLEGYELYRLRVWDVLRNVATSRVKSGVRKPTTATAAALARAALRG